MKKQLLSPLEWYTEKRKVKDLIPYEYNPRKQNPVRLAKLKESLKIFNLVEIPAINLDNKIIAGHQRVEILFQLGRGEEMIDVRIPNRALTKEEFKEYNLRSNIQIGEWDKALLNEYFSDMDFEGIGFNPEELTFLENMTEIQPEEEKDFDADPPEVIVSKPGDVFELYSLQKDIIHRVVCGDSCEQNTYQKLLKNKERFNAVVTDPPYNVNYEGGTKKRLKIKNDNMDSKSFYKFLYHFYEETFLNTFPGGAIYVFHADTEGLNFRKAFKDAGFKLSQCLIWLKNRLVMCRQDYQWKHEPCLYGWKDPDETIKEFQPVLYGWKEGEAHYWGSDRRQTTILEFDKPIKSEDHPTMKPVPLFSYLIKNSSKQKDIIGDPFLGSGTTLIACEQSWRVCRGIELTPGYVDVIIKRWINYMEDNSLTYKLMLNGKPISKEYFPSASKVEENK